MDIGGLDISVKGVMLLLGVVGLSKQPNNIKAKMEIDNCRFIKSS
ncbi:hypothetical protein [Moraxella lacunata]